MCTAMSQTQMAQKTWEMENNIMEFSNNIDEIYKYDRKQQQDILIAKPWDKDPNYFKELKISALALLKMVMHARSGGNLEIMGLMQGKVDGYAMIVMDSFALPVEGTETRVNAQAQAYEYMAAYNESSKQVGRLENVIGWYHSHPGYGCWLSGIDVSTQMLNQQFQEPFVAIVIDPVRTITAGKVNIGAFRTYPKGYKASNESPNEYQTIPLNKIEDFGVHCKSYYSLDISYFKSKLDSQILGALWNKYWINTLTSSNLFKNKQQSYLTGQMRDLTEKLEQNQTNSAAFGTVTRRNLLGAASSASNLSSQNRPLSPRPSKSKNIGKSNGSKQQNQIANDENEALDSLIQGSFKEPQDKLAKIVKDGCKSITEALLSFSSLLIKDRLFNIDLSVDPSPVKELPEAAAPSGSHLPTSSPEKDTNSAPEKDLLNVANVCETNDIMESCNNHFEPNSIDDDNNINNNNDINNMALSNNTNIEEAPMENGENMVLLKENIAMEEEDNSDNILTDIISRLPIKPNITDLQILLRNAEMLIN